MKLVSTILRSTTVVLTAVVLFACSQKDSKITIEGFDNRALVPDMDVINVSTVISDSGITRYRISSPRWLVYNKANCPYWHFPKGLKLENFDEHLHVNASLRADRARYDSQNQIWRLEGNVEVMNTKGDIFRSPVLFWNQKAQTIYSDTTIDITTHDSHLHGHGFVSNQDMTKYTIQNPSGFTTEN